MFTALSILVTRLGLESHEITLTRVAIMNVTLGLVYNGVERMEARLRTGLLNSIMDNLC